VTEVKALLSAGEFAWAMWRAEWDDGATRNRTYKLLQSDNIRPHVIRRGRIYEVPAWIVKALRDGVGAERLTAACSLPPQKVVAFG
jgi:hypothetical protein